jgi:dipeptidyl aminopeptidase/acylaminoacyl peptidase
MPRHLILAAIVGTFSGSAFAQGTKEDYDRARNLARTTRDKVTRAKVEPNWFDGNKRFWYRSDLGRGTSEFVLVDAAAGKRELAFDHTALARTLSQAAGKPVEPTKLPFDRIDIRDDGRIRFKAFDRTWHFDPKSGEVVEEKAKPEPTPEVEQQPRPGRQRRFGESPDGKWTITVKDNNLFAKPRDGEEVVLTKDGTADDFYSGAVFWSPDSSRLVAMKTRRGEERKVYMIESSPRDQLQPKLQSMTYPKPGDRLTVSFPHLFDIGEKKEIPLTDDLFHEPWSNQQVHWADDSSEFSFVHNQRGHQVLRLVGISRDGKARAIIDEHSKTFIDYAHKFYLHEVPGTGEIIWMSERDGWNHLYLYDRKTGTVKNQITRGEWVVWSVERVDDTKHEIEFRCSGIDPKQDPYYVHYCRIKFDGTGLVRLTEGDGIHIIKYAPNREFFIDTYSRVDLAPVNELRRASDGKLVCALESADMKALLATGWRAPERFVAKGRDGKTDIYGLIFRPTNFDPNKKYPVIEDIYAGPQGSFVPKAFASMYAPQELAELGFITVKIDGMGTSYRSKAFHDVCCKNLGDSGFPDRIPWIKAAAAKYPYMDLSRVGIHGGSAGGQSALRALEAHGDFYKAAVAACGCHDNRMDKVWWNELWMGYPIGPHYAEQSNVTNAKNITGKLLLIVGELDRNVDPASTMQVVNSLIKADKDFDLLVVPGAGHGGGGPYGHRRLLDFFVRNLLGVEPRRESAK